MRNCKTIAAVLAVLLVLTAFMACAQPAAEPATEVTEAAQTTETTVEAETEPAEETTMEKPKLVVISNRSFGDKGPIDSQEAVLSDIEAMGFETKTIESLSPEVYEEDIRAMANAGYNLIATSFPPVSEAVVAVAKDFPDTKFISIYQFTNSGDEKIDNIWSTEYKAQEMMYVIGCIQGKLTKTNKVGIISGQETASSNSGINGFIDGVLAANPDCEVEYIFAGTYDDPTIGKEIALAMISRGVDCIATSAGKTSTGAIEACQENDVYIVADNGDYYDLGGNVMVTYFLTDFGQVIKMGAEDYLNGEFKGGEHTIMSIFNKGAVVKWEYISRFTGDNPDKAEAVQAAADFAQEQENKILSGEITIEFKPDTPVAVRKG